MRKIVVIGGSGFVGCQVVTEVDDALVGEVRFRSWLGRRLVEY